MVEQKIQKSCVESSSQKFVNTIINEKIKPSQIIDTRINKISLNIIVIYYAGLENKE